MADRLAMIDGTQVVRDDGPTGTTYALAVQVEGFVSATDPDDLGPAVNALYGRVLRAVQTDPVLAGLGVHVLEGADDGDADALEVTVERAPGHGLTAGFVLHLTCDYWQPRGGTPRRETILAALATALGAAPALVGTTVREQCLAALQGVLATQLAVAVPRNVPRPVAPATAATVLVDGPHAVSYATAGLALVTLRAAVELLQPDSDEAALDGRVQAVLAAVRTDERLGGLAVDVVADAVDPEALREAFTTPTLGARVDVAVTYGVPPTDPCTVAA